MGGIASDITEVIGNTPLVRLNKVTLGIPVSVVAKIESLNPCGSVKDRVAAAMIEAAEREGRLRPGAVIVEPTSGNTGVALASVAAARGYRLVLTMPDTVSGEKRRLPAALGAEVVLTPGREGMTQQFKNRANPRAHM
jgi:cysteine synthase A